MMLSVGDSCIKYEDLSPEAVPGELESYPYKAVSAVYIFTILENHGDEIVEIVNPGYLKDRQAWHRSVYSDADLNNKEELDRAKRGFAKPFRANSSKIPGYVVKRLINIKKTRNKFMHEGRGSLHFDIFFSSVIATVVFIHLLLLPSDKEISVYPYEDYHGKWQNL